MKHQIEIEQKPLTYNDCVRLAYLSILKQAKQMLAKIEQYELRCTLERSDNVKPVKGRLVHEFLNPLLFLKLEYDAGEQLTIHFGIEEINRPGQLSSITSAFLRLLYKVTMNGAYPIDIEQCVKTDWFLKNCCSEAYEYIEDRNKYHLFKRIKYKGSTVNRKQILSVA